MGDKQYITTEALEAAVKLWNEYKKLRFDMEHIKNATRFSYYVKEAPTGMVDVDNVELREFVVGQMQRRMHEIDLTLRSMGVAVA